MSHQFIKNRDIILFGSQAWDTGIGSNFKDMAFELARYNRVLFINRALDRSYYKRFKADTTIQSRIQAVQQKKDALEKVQNNLWVYTPSVLLESINKIPIPVVHDWLNKRNTRKLAASINKAIAQLAFSNSILINDNDFIRGFYLAEMIPCETHIFYIRDFMMGVDFFQRHGQRHETGLIRKADLVVANSAYLANYAGKNNTNSFNIGQGCDLTQFLATDLNMPSDMAAIPKPIIGYMGNISVVRIDADVIKYIAQQLPQCQLVLVGPADKEFPTQELSAIPNIHLLGPKPPDTLAAYIAHFDICINPQILNPVTIGNYPRKVDEYLAMGKPVVATATEAMELFGEHTFLCKNRNDYVTHIRYLLVNREAMNASYVTEERKRFALSHTWENSIGLLGDAYHKVSLEKVIAKP
jgi:glycosyltransferase involved in cell wall biosynthesis